MCSWNAVIHMKFQYYLEEIFESSPPSLSSSHQPIDVHCRAKDVRGRHSKTLWPHGRAMCPTHWHLILAILPQGLFIIYLFHHFYCQEPKNDRNPKKPRLYCQFNIYLGMCFPIRTGPARELQHIPLHSERPVPPQLNVETVFDAQLAEAD